MGGGIAGWLTPGWMTREKRLEPHLDKQAFIKESLSRGENPKEDVM